MSKKLMLVFMALAMLLALSGCGSKAATADSLPVYPGATKLNPGDDPVADTLAKNMEQDAALRQSMGAGGKIEQGSYKLPADASWDKVKAYYDEQLKAQGWKEGLGGIGGNIASQALQMTNQSTDMMKLSMYSKGKQVLTIFRLMETPDATQAYLIYSLNSN